MKKYTDSTLMSFTKKDLIEIIKCLYYNNEALKKQNEQQYKNCKNFKPIIHGHWESANDSTHFCSKCGFDAMYTHNSINSFISSKYTVSDCISNYCPNCGAIMDEKGSSHWIAFHSEEDLDPFLDWKYLCSNCAHICRAKRDMCPNCCAKMDKGSK